MKESIQEIEITNNVSLKNNNDFNIILSIIDELATSGIIFKLANNCISACDIMQAMLSRNGIESEIVEVQAIIVKHQLPKMTMFVGFDNQNTFGQELDTHAIVVTKTEIPMIVDISLGHLLPDVHPWVVEALTATVEENTIADFKFKDFDINYKRKKHMKIPEFHKKGVLDKIKNEFMLRKQVDWIKNC